MVTIEEKIEMFLETFYEDKKCAWKIVYDGSVLAHDGPSYKVIWLHTYSIDGDFLAKFIAFLTDEFKGEHFHWSVDARGETTKKIPYPHCRIYLAYDFRVTTDEYIKFTEELAKQQELSLDAPELVLE